MSREKRRVITTFMLAMINVAAICNIANLSFTAQQGFSSLFYYLFTAIVFFLLSFLACEKPDAVNKKIAHNSSAVVTTIVGLFLWPAASSFIGGHSKPNTT